MLVDSATVASQIGSGKSLFLAGDENLLKRLPKGNWIGGTIPYFMDRRGDDNQGLDLHDGGHRLGDRRRDFLVRGEGSCPASFRKRPTTASPSSSFRLRAQPTSATRGTPPAMKGIFLKPIIGWISGVDLNDLGKISPKVFNGATGESSDAKAIAMHLTLASGKQASIGIVNLFRQGSGDVIAFDEESFSLVELPY